jgi:sugar (pentulose or hexulose) kinase
MKTNCTLVFDIGKTNQKYFVFDENRGVLDKGQTNIPTIVDEDEHPAEDIKEIVQWMTTNFERLLNSDLFEIKNANISGHGATFVHLDSEGEVVTPVYDYHKPIEENTFDSFYHKYGPEANFSTQTGSKNVEMLNSGKQIYWLKTKRPELFEKVKYSLHLPQYLSYVFTGKMFSEYSSIGCHTDLWDFEKQQYHQWVLKEGIIDLLPPIARANETVSSDFSGKKINFGIGIHDSSAALLPYFKKSEATFLLISTGTWCITFNPFVSNSVFSPAEINNGAIAYMKIDGSIVKTSRLFMGQEHKIQVKKLISQFEKPELYHRNLKFNNQIFNSIKEKETNHFRWEYLDLKDCPEQEDLNFNSFEEAYHQLMTELMSLLEEKILILYDEPPKTFFVDGGFSDNDIFLKLLKIKFYNQVIVSKPEAYGSSLGAAIVMGSII